MQMLHLGRSHSISQFKRYISHRTDIWEEVKITVGVTKADTGRNI